VNIWLCWVSYVADIKNLTVVIPFFTIIYTVFQSAATPVKCFCTKKWLVPETEKLRQSERRQRQKLLRQKRQKRRKLERQKLLKDSTQKSQKFKVLPLKLQLLPLG
jgi:hypothetical protein